MIRIGFQRGLSDEFVAAHPWVAQAFHGMILLSIAAFAGVAIFLAATLEPKAAVAGPDADSLMVLTALTALHFSLLVPALLVAWRVPGFLARRRARQLAKDGSDEAKLAARAAKLFYDQTILRAIALESVASTGLIVCLLTAIQGGPAIFYANAATAGLFLAYGLSCFPTRQRLRDLTEDFARLVQRERDHLRAATP